MKKVKRAGIVAIIGRANTGKSSLFNSMLKRREAITFDEAGTTRDSLWAKVSADNKDFWLIDTAGVKKAEDDFELTIQEQVLSATEVADLILLVIEAHTPLSDDDRRVAKMALKSKKPVILVANKADKQSGHTTVAYARLGIKDVVLTSTTQQTGLVELSAAIVDKLPNVRVLAKAKNLNLALVGRPNVGKSSLFNALLKKQQAVVADHSGTTRDTNRRLIKYKGFDINLIDTAGIRRSGRTGKDVEYFSMLRALYAIEESDICLLLVEASEPGTHLDQKIAGMIKQVGKGLIIVISKWDSVEKTAFTRDQMAPKIASDFDFTPWAPLIFSSAHTGQNVNKILELAIDIMARRQAKYKTSELNAWLKAVVESHPPAGLKNRQPKLNYMVHEEGNPTPSFKIFGSKTKYLHWSYKRYMEKEFRRRWPLDGTPLKFWFIEKKVK